MREVVISVRNASKQYVVWRHPLSRLARPTLRGLAGLPLGPVRARCKALAAGQRSEVQALQNVSLELEKGSSLGLIGRNGSGKSTLLQAIAGTLELSSGRINVRGRVAALLELGCGFHPDFSGRENAILNGLMMGLTRAEMRERMESIAAFAELGDFLDRPLRTYSSGMTVRLAFAVMVHVDPDVLIIDEALAVGDAPFIQKCMRFIHRFREHGTLLIVSHDAGAIQSLCDRAAWLDHGVLRADGDARSVTDQYLEFCFGQKPQGREEAPGQRNSTVSEPMAPENEAGTGEAVEHGLNEITPPADDFGVGGLKIDGVSLEDADGRPVQTVKGGEQLTLRIVLEATRWIAQPIAGFYLRNRHGQNIFGENTWLTTREGNFQVDAGQRLVVAFSFSMPILEMGHYSICVGGASGTMEDPRVECWRHEALVLHSVSRTPWRGLVGIPMSDVSCQILPGGSAVFSGAADEYGHGE